MTLLLRASAKYAVQGRYCSLALSYGKISNDKHSIIFVPDTELL